MYIERNIREKRNIYFKQVPNKRKLYNIRGHNNTEEERDIQKLKYEQ